MRTERDTPRSLALQDLAPLVSGLLDLHKTYDLDLSFEPEGLWHG